MDLVKEKKNIKSKFLDKIFLEYKKINNKNKNEKFIIENIILKINFFFI